MAPALEALGRHLEDVRWILLTHGHIDHIGGTHAMWKATGRRAQVVIHEADARLLRSRQAHVDAYLGTRGSYLQDPDGAAKFSAAAQAVISGEMEPTLLVRGGETLSLGGDVTVSVHSIPGHTPGSVAYVVDGQNDVFVGDAVQVHGAANGFPGYENHEAYRTSLQYLRDEIDPQYLYLGHPYRRSDGVAYGGELDRTRAAAALRESIEIEGGVRGAAHRCLCGGLLETDTEPVQPGAIEEYVLRLYPFANTFMLGHKLVVELSNNEPPADEHNALLPPDAFHLPVGRPVTHKIYRDAGNPSRLVLPIATHTATN